MLLALFEMVMRSPKHVQTSSGRLLIIDPVPRKLVKKGPRNRFGILTRDRAPRNTNKHGISDEDRHNQWVRKYEMRKKGRFFGLKAIRQNHIAEP